MKKEHRIPRKIKKKQRQYKRYSRDIWIKLARLNGSNPNYKGKRYKHTKYSESAVRIQQFEPDKAEFHNANNLSPAHEFWMQFLAKPVSIEASLYGLPTIIIPSDSVPEVDFLPLVRWGDFKPGGENTPPPIPR